MEVSTIISTIALLIVVYVYVKHDRQLKAQGKLLNEFELKKYIEEEKDNKKAIIEANVIKRISGNRVIKVYNRGKSIGRNVIVYFQEEKSIAILNNPSPIDIIPKDSIEITLLRNEESPEKLEIYFEWEDELNTKNKESQTIQI